MVERIRLLLETRQLTPTQFADAIGIARPIVSHILSGRNKPSLEVVQRILAAMPDLSMPWLLNGTGTMQAEAVASTPPPPVVAAVGLPQPVLQLAEQEIIVPDVAAATVNPAPLSSATPTPLRRNGASLSPDPKPVTLAANQPGPKRFESSPKSAPFTTQAAHKQAVLAVELPVPESQTAPQPGLAQVLPPAPPQPQPENLALPRTVATAPASVPVTAPADDEASHVPSIAAALFPGAEKPIRRIVIFYRDGSFADYQPE